ncbi:unnamed protein product [Meloidogyne enterolobii]|uniref:Uncharacterized protein n=1 Tax=Meloidogyne enterolobii TaxID=390850 RepID=A0ACB1AYR4_MELEN
MQVLLWKPNTNETSPKEITAEIEGCQNNSTLERFVERSKSYQMLPSPKDYCSQLLQPLNNAARLLIQWKLKMLILMGIPSIVANVV